MLEAALTAIENMFSCPCAIGVVPVRFLFLFLGVVMGLSLGAIPGLGGLVGLAVILPFTHTMDPLAAVAIMIGLIATTTTSDTIPSVLFAVPGTTGSQATILDGHPMARKGEAGRAFGAAYMSSMLGGIFGALVLALSIPILRPLVLILGSPEFFMMGILGISMVAVLSGRAPVKGLIAGALGLMVGMVGVDPQTGGIRWAFGYLYLWDGVPLVPVTLGLFAIPEIVDLVIKGTRIADVPSEKIKGAMVGIRDTFRHWFLVVRSSVIGVWVGFIPGLGTSVVDWFAYGHAVQTEKGAKETFGKGDVRGVIAPESANNAKEGGGLIPTIAFGIPGSASMALFIAALIIHGISPGPDMIAKRLDLTYTMIWSLAIANILGTGICLGLTPVLAAVSRARIKILAPLVIIIVFLAAFQASRHMGDLIALLFFSIFGWSMKRAGWPRPPLVLGLVLSKLVENYLFISVGAYGFAWLQRPIVLLIAGLTIFSIVFGARQAKQASGKIPAGAGSPAGFRMTGGLFFAFFISLVVAASLFTSREWSFGTRMFPWAIGIPALFLCAIQLVLEFRQARRPAVEEDDTGMMDLAVERGIPMAQVAERAANIFGWVFGLFAAIWLFGFVLTAPLFVWLYLTFEAREKWWISSTWTAIIVVFLLSLFHYLLRVPWPDGFIEWPQATFLEWIG